MKRFLAMCAILSVAVLFTGCEKKKAEIKETEKVTTPDGTSTTTDTHAVETTGDNPPAK